MKLNIMHYSLFAFVHSFHPQHVCAFVAYNKDYLLTYLFKMTNDYLAIKARKCNRIIRKQTSYNYVEAQTKAYSHC